MRLSGYTVTVGTAQPLDVAQGEDREIRLAFVDGGAPVDMTGCVHCYLRVRNPANGLVWLEREYDDFLDSDPTNGTPRFILVPADTSGEVPAVHDCDVTWEDADGNKAQLLVLSPFDLGPAAG